MQRSTALPSPLIFQPLGFSSFAAVKLGVALPENPIVGTLRLARMCVRATQTYRLGSHGSSFSRQAVPGMAPILTTACCNRKSHRGGFLRCGVFISPCNTMLRTLFLAIASVVALALVAIILLVSHSIERQK